MDFNSLMSAADDVLISTFNVGSGDKKGITLWPGESREINIEAVFDNPYARVDIPGGGKITTSEPSFTAHDRDITELQKKDTVSIQDIVWYVKELQPDGSGITRVFLSKYKKSSSDVPGGRL
ncbi:TPA: head-tail joining protein [Citrobacter braakii]